MLRPTFRYCRVPGRRKIDDWTHGRVDLISTLFTTVARLAVCPQHRTNTGFIILLALSILTRFPFNTQHNNLFPHSNEISLIPQTIFSNFWSKTFYCSKYYFQCFVIDICSMFSIYIRTLKNTHQKHTATLFGMTYGNLLARSSDICNIWSVIMFLMFLSSLEMNIWKIMSSDQ